MLLIRLEGLTVNYIGMCGISTIIEARLWWNRPMCMFQAVSSGHCKPTMDSGNLSLFADLQILNRPIEWALNSIAAVFFFFFSQFLYLF